MRRRGDKALVAKLKDPTATDRNSGRLPLWPLEEEVLAFADSADCAANFLLEQIPGVWGIEAVGPDQDQALRKRR